MRLYLDMCSLQRPLDTKTQLRIIVEAQEKRIKSLHEITQEAIQILSKEMVIADTIRFLNQFSLGYGDYTQERDAMFQDLTLDDISEQMDKSE